jgi:ELWxxDGT repeat protein
MYKNITAALLLLAAWTAHAATPAIVRDINTTVIPASSDASPAGVLNGKLIFGAKDATGPGIWSSDGTSAGTQLLKRLGAGGSVYTGGAHGFFKVGNRAFFTADDGTHGAELWVTDGTADGTAMAVEFRTDPNAGGLPEILGMLGSKLLVRAMDASSVRQLYITDGTQAGTQALSNVAYPGTGASEEVFVSGAKAYFAVSDNVGNRFFVTDGSMTGTHEVSSPFGHTSVGWDLASHPRSFHQVGNRVLYTAAGLLWTLDVTTDSVDGLSTMGTPGFGPPKVSFSTLIPMDGYVLFLNTTSAPAVELWRSDGTPAGTYSLSVVNASPTFDDLQFPIFGKVGDTVVFVGNDGTGAQLFSSDGTSITQLTHASVPPAWPFRVAVPIATLADIGYFVVADGSSVTTWSIWRTDGTLAGTRKISAFPSMEQSTSVLPIAHGDGTIVYFEITDGNGTRALVKYDPATEQTTTLKGGVANMFADYLFDAGRLYFRLSDGSLGYEPWVSDGTVAGTHVIKDINPQVANQSANPDWLVAFDGKLAFTADDGISGNELWISDGTAAGTTRAADIWPGDIGSDPTSLFASSGALYFFAYDKTTQQRALMRLAAGSSTPVVIAPLSPDQTFPPFGGPFFSIPCDGPRSATLGNKVFFAANDGQTNLSLWMSDGTSAGTRPVHDATGAALGLPCGFTVFNNRVVFAAVDAIGIGLWATDGTDAGTVRLGDVAPGIFTGAGAYVPTALGDKLYFRAVDKTYGNRLWQTDGTPAGTALAVDFGNGSQATGFMALRGVVNGKLLVEIANFVSGVSDYQLWATDGTQAGSVRLKVSVAHQNQYQPIQDFVISGNRAYFAAKGTAGVEPWMTDGTDAGTAILKDINPAGDSNPFAFGSLGGGMALFIVTDPARGQQLWRTNGTAAGTVLVSDVPPAIPLNNQATPNGKDRLLVGQNYFFIAQDPAQGIELFALADDLPVAGADSGTSANGAATSINVLANDTDSDGVLDNSTVTITTNPSHGTASVTTGGVISYTPTAGFAGTDTFAYTVSDNQGGTSAPATVTVTSSVQSVPPVTSGANSKGGGGAMGLLELLGLMLFAIGAQFARRRRTLPLNQSA